MSHQLQACYPMAVVSNDRADNTHNGGLSAAVHTVLLMDFYTVVIAADPLCYHAPAQSI